MNKKIKLYIPELKHTGGEHRAITSHIFIDNVKNNVGQIMTIITVTLNAKFTVLSSSQM